MPTITDDAVCIRRWDFSETSQTVSLLTREHGIVRGLAKGAKREKGLFSGGLDVLTRGEIVAIVRPGRDLATLTAWHLIDTYQPIRRSLAANRAGMYMADLIHHMLLDHDPHPRLYDSLTDALDMLGEADSIDHAMLRLQWSLLVETGYRPELDRDAQSGAALPADAATIAFSATAGGVVIEAAGPGGTGSWRVRRETIELLRSLASGQTLESQSHDAIRRANRLLAVYCRFIIGSEPPAMRWAFPDLTA